MKTGGSYDTVVLGVSEQTPQNRRSGQMQEQVNMISDPVHGLTRRHGSQYINATRISDTADVLVPYKTSPNLLLHEFNCNGADYDVLHHTAAPTAPVEPMYCFSKTASQFVPVQGKGAIWEAIKANGVASMVNIGRFLFIAAKGFTPQYTTTNNAEADNAAKKCTIWIRNGDYSRDYSLTVVTTAGVKKKITYHTPASSYPGKLDSSWIPVPTIDMSGNPDANTISQRVAKFNQDMSDYNKKVADVTNAYNSAVTAWVGESTAAIQPTNIAAALAANIRTALGVSEDHVTVDNQYIFIGSGAGVMTGSVVDGGDGTYVRAVISSTDDPTNLTPIAYYGKIVKVKSKKANGKETYFVRAEAKSSEDTLYNSWGEVTWREYCGIQTTPTQVFAMATVANGTLYVGSTPEELEQMSGQTIPKYVASSVGDQVSSPVPAFMKKAITYLGTFQDRLLIGSGSTIFASRPGDYLNWFRQSILDVDDSDPVEMYALGSEDDTITCNTSFDRNHIMFGSKFQYLIPGRSILTPKNPTIQIMSAIEDAIDAQPQASGNFVFYGKSTANKGSLHQIQVGATSDTSESYECSQQLDKYIQGKPTQIVCSTAPYMVLMRTSGNYHGFYVYTYLDSMQGGSRQFDSWSRWEWDSALGPCVGLSKWKGELLNYTLRNTSTGLWLVCDKFTFDTDLPDVPLLDSWRSMGPFKQYPLWWDSSMLDITSVGYRSSSDYFLIGSRYSGIDTNIPGWESDLEHLTIGINFSAHVIPTNPYKQDQNGKSITGGRLTISSVAFSLDSSGGMLADLILPNYEKQILAYDGRRLTRQANLIGRAPLISEAVSVPVYRETREYSLRISAINWLPLTITGVEWVGQWFNRQRYR